MQCKIHLDRPTHSTCEICSEQFCEGCLVEVVGKFYCKEHVAQLIREKNSHSAHSNAPRYSHHYYNHYSFNDNYPYRSRFVALFLCIFLGVLGVHRFYVGKVGTGVLYFFTGGLFALGWIIDIVRIVSGEFLDVNGRPLR